MWSYYLAVPVGHNPYVLLSKYELEDALEKSKRRPKFYALRLAEKLFGLDVLIKSTPYGIGGKAALNPVILDAIKRNDAFLLIFLFGAIKPNNLFTILVYITLIC